MRLVACRNCHTQFDVSNVAEKTFACRCGETVENSPAVPRDAEIQRCGSCGALLTAATSPGAAQTRSCDYCGSAIVRDRRNLSLICPECYARNAEDSRFCTACGVAFRPETVPVGSAGLSCPCCEVPLAARRVAGLEVDECPECNGLWAPADRFEQLVARAVEARRAAPPERLEAMDVRRKGANPAGQRVQYRNCPACGVMMQRRNFRKASGVIIDRCHAHGAWLDADELEQIAGYVLSGGRPAAEQFMRETEADAQRVLREASRDRLAAEARARATSAQEPSLLDFLSRLLD